MKKISILIALIVGGLKCHAASIGFSPTTGQVSVSTAASNPTLIFSSDVNSNRTVIVNNTAFNLYVRPDTSFSISATTGSFYVPPLSSWSPDGPTDAYRGALYGVIDGTTTAQGIGRFRAR